MGAYDETSLDSGGQERQFRQGDFPLPLGESIMLNHALFGGLMKAGAIPVTDDPFHHRVLLRKIQRLRQMPGMRGLLEELERSTNARSSFLAMASFQDPKLRLELPAFAPEVPIERLYEFRTRHAAELERARTEMAWLAQEIEHGPWTDEFERAVAHEMLPRFQAQGWEARPSNPPGARCSCQGGCDDELTRRR